MKYQNVGYQVHAAGVVLAALALAACKQDGATPAALDVKPAPLEATAAATAPSATAAPYQYRSASRQSPFEPSYPGAVVAAQGLQPDAARSRQPLERFRLEELRMVGTMASGATRHALVADPTGRIHRVSAGDYLGGNHGRIDRLREDAVMLREIVRSGNGGWVWRPRSLPLALASEPAEEENDPPPSAAGDEPQATASAAEALRDDSEQEVSGA